MRRKMLALSLDGLTAFSVVPLRFAMALGVAVSAASFVYLCYVVLTWLLESRRFGVGLDGRTRGLVGGIQLFTIGVLGEYIGRIFLA
jgi:dolichol-phosphate mannosyltransferase